MNSTTPPMKTIMIGSMMLVSAVTDALDLAVVGVGGPREHRLELAALLADRDHVHQQRREEAALA